MPQPPETPRLSVPLPISPAEAAAYKAAVDAIRARNPKKPPPERSCDDLMRIRGIGVLISKKLNALGVYRYDQIGRWTEVDIVEYSIVLGFNGRIQREDWIGQAQILARGESTEFSDRVDSGD